MAETKFTLRIEPELLEAIKKYYGYATVNRCVVAAVNTVLKELPERNSKIYKLSSQLHSANLTIMRMRADIGALARAQASLAKWADYDADQPADDDENDDDN